MGIVISGVAVTMSIRQERIHGQSQRIFKINWREDQALEQLTFKEYIDPFMGSKNE